MRAVKRIVDGKILSQVIELPRSFQNQQVEVIAYPVARRSPMPQMTKKEIADLLKGSVAESIAGILPDNGLSYDEMRAERIIGK